MLTAYISVFCMLAILSGLWVAIAKHPITGAVGLVAMMISLAGLYGLLAGPFLGIVQITVYAGAIMMLIIFVIMVVGGAMDYDRPKAGVMGIIGGIGALTFGLVACAMSLADVAPHGQVFPAPSKLSVCVCLTSVTAVVGGTSLLR